MIVTIYRVQAYQVAYPLSIQDGRQRSKVATTKFSVYDLSTSDGGDFPRIIEIALFCYNSTSGFAQSIFFRAKALLPKIWDRMRKTRYPYLENYVRQERIIHLQTERVSLYKRDKQAFVNRDALVNTLENNDISGNFLLAIKSIYKSVLVDIKINDNTSDFFEFPTGLNQGSQLSQKLFTIFMTEISKAIITNGRQGTRFLQDYNPIYHVIFADDLFLYQILLLVYKIS